MSNRQRSLLALVTFLGLLSLLPAVASSTPLVITRGGLEGDPDGALVTLKSATGFFLQAGGHYTGGHWAPGECARTLCVPGQTYSLEAGWSGKDFPGTVRVDGQTYELGLPSETVAYADVLFDGSWVAPRHRPSAATKAVGRPFVFEGLVEYPMGGLFERLELAGSGQAKLHLTWQETPDQQGWALTTARYRFKEPPTTAATSVPEPPLWLLFAAGLIVTVARRLQPRRGHLTEPAA